MSSKKRLKILFIAALYPSQDSPVRGVFIREHAQAASLYNDIRVIAFDDSSKSVRGLYKVSAGVENGIKTYRMRTKKLPIPKTKRLLRWWGLLDLFRKMFREGYRPDIIHAHIYSAGAPAVILGIVYNIQVIITEHLSVFPRRALSPYKKMLARFAMKRAKIVLPVSENLKEHIQHYGINNKFCVVPNAVDTKIFFPAPNVNINTNAPKRILAVALLVPIKGIPNLLGALQQTEIQRNDFLLDIIGDGPMRAEYEKLASELQLDNLVKFHGVKSKEEIAVFMRQCDFFVHPSLWETFGVVLTEAMASGKPVVATNVGALNEIVSEEVGLLISPSDKDALVKGITYMLDNFRAYCPEDIARYAREKFSYEAVGNRLNEIYRKILKPETSKARSNG